ncbi:MAG TPA: dihydrofolate reductase family protein [Bacteroidales bacterium]|nr:dihydrofolate reductase family protein [Bacteroidales bacterium]
MADERKVISNVAMSLDGYIALPDGDISFLSEVEKEGEDYGYADFIKTIDTIIVGRKTYDKILEIGFKYPDDKEVYVITRDEKPGKQELKFYSGSLKKLVSELKSVAGEDIFCDGGSEIINQLLMDNLIDEFIISVIPVILGDGIPLFKKKISRMNLKLIDCQKFDTGLVQMHYTKIDEY